LIFAIDKDYEAKLRDKIACFVAENKTKKSVRLVLITAFGLKQNTYSDLIQNILTINDLFKE